MDLKPNIASLSRGIWAGLIVLIAAAVLIKRVELLKAMRVELLEIASMFFEIASVLSLPAWLFLLFGSIAAIFILIGLMNISLDRMTISLDRHTTLNKVLKIIAGVYMVSISALGLFALLRYEFRWASINYVLNIASLVLTAPTLFVLYLNRSTKWARISLASLPIVILCFSPFPAAVEARILISSAAVPSFFLRDAKRWQRRMGVPIGVVAGLSLAVLPYSLILFFLGLSATTTSLSPDRKHEVEVSGTNLGALGGSVTAALYRVHPGSATRRFEGYFAEREDWPARVEIKWIDDHTVEIRGERFYIGQ